MHLITRAPTQPGQSTRARAPPRAARLQPHAGRPTGLRQPGPIPKLVRRCTKPCVLTEAL